MESSRVVKLIGALGLLSIAALTPAAARAQSRSAPDTTRPVAAGQTADTVRATKGPRPPTQFDRMAARRGARKAAPRGSAAPAAPAAPPQAPVKVKPRVDPPPLR